MPSACESSFVERYFTGTATQIEGVGLAEIAEEAFRRHADAFGDNPVFAGRLDVGGDYAYRLRGEPHAWTPEAVADLQHAVRGNARDELPRVRRRSERRRTRAAEDAARAVPHPHGRGDGPKPIPLDEVEPASEIVKRFSTGAMSFGSISREAHTTLAIAMNRIGGKSNTGEGGEEPDRFKPLPNGDSMRSAIKQVASGRFGVTAEYLVNADDAADQDGAGRQARRGRPAARPQGRRDHRPGALFDARRRPHLAAAASRHLLDRGSGAAHLRSEERQSARRDLGQARLRGRRRHGRGGRRQGARRPRHHLAATRAAPAPRR